MSLDLVNSIISVVGVITGSSSLLILGWKRYKKRFLIYEISGFYTTKESKVPGFTDLTAIIDTGFFNDSDETVSVTDIVGTIKYNKERLNRLPVDQRKLVRRDVLTTWSESRFAEPHAISVLPHETMERHIVLEFPEVMLNCIDRMRSMKFAGFIDGKMPLMIHDETEFEKNWTENPPTLLLTVHVNAQKQFKRYIQLNKENQRVDSGTLNIIDITRIENDFRDKF